MWILWDRKCEYGDFQITHAKNSLQITPLRLVIWQDFWHLWFGKPHTHISSSQYFLTAVVHDLDNGDVIVFTIKCQIMQSWWFYYQEIPFRYQNCKNCKLLLLIRILIWLKYSWNLLMCGSGLTNDIESTAHRQLGWKSSASTICAERRL